MEQLENNGQSKTEQVKNYKRKKTRIKVCNDDIKQTANCDDSKAEPGIIELTFKKYESHDYEKSNEDH